MAETLVLARITVDAQGVVTGLGLSDKAIAKTKANFGGLGSASDVLTNRLFSARRALLAIGTAFGIAGVVYTLANAVKTLATDVVTSTEGFKLGAAAITDWYNSLIKGEDAVERLSRKMKGISAIGGFTGEFGTFTKLDALRQQRAELEKLLKSLESPRALRSGIIGAGPAGMLMTYLFGTTDTTGDIPAERIAAIRGELVQLSNEIDKLMAGSPSPEQGPINQALKARLTPGDVMGKQGLVGQFGLEDIRVIETLASSGAIPKLASEMALLNAEANLTRDAFGDFVAEIDGDAFTNFLADMASHAETAQLAVGGLQAAMAVFGDTLGQVASGGSITFKSFVADALKATAQLLFAFGAALIAKGFLTDTPLYIQQGIAAIAAGVVASAAAGALAGGGSSHRSGSSGGGGGGGGRRNRGEQSITVNVSGWVGDEASLGREVIKWIREAGLNGAAA